MHQCWGVARGLQPLRIEREEGWREGLVKRGPEEGSSNWEREGKMRLRLDNAGNGSEIELLN